MTAVAELAFFVCDCCRTTVHLGLGVPRPDPPLCRTCAAPFSGEPGEFKCPPARCKHVGALLAEQVKERHALPRPERRGPLRRIGDWFR